MLRSLGLRQQAYAESSRPCVPARWLPGIRPRLRRKDDAMAERMKHSTVVAGNIFFCDFRRSAAVQASGKAGLLLHKARDVRLIAETLQGACRDLISSAPLLVRQAELNAADVICVASMIDELAFQAHLMATHGEDSAGPDAGSLQHALLEAAAVTIEIQGCMSAANDAAETLLRRLREQSERALRLGCEITEKIDCVSRDEA